MGLDFLHSMCSIIHTDLKPENVLLCPIKDQYAGNLEEEANLLAKQLATSQPLTKNQKRRCVCISVYVYVYRCICVYVSLCADSCACVCVNAVDVLAGCYNVSCCCYYYYYTTTIITVLQYKCE